MKWKQWISRGVLATGFVAYGFFSWTPLYTPELTVVMLNIGQGDAIYIRTPEGTDILIDGGPDRSVLFELGRVMPPLDHHIEYVIATHPDADHINGLVELPSMYTIGTLVMNGDPRDTTAANALRSWQEQGISVVDVSRGDVLSADVPLTVVHPDPSETYEDTNARSLVLLMRYGDMDLLFTGDATVESEYEMMQWYVQTYDKPIDVDLLKVGHHGSHTSTSAEFVKRTTPSIALISAGVENRYGHPHPSVITRLERAGVQVFRTDRDGRVRCAVTQQTVTCRGEE